MAKRSNLPVAYRGDGSERHIERIEHRIAFDNDEACGPEGQREQDGQRDYRQSSRNVLHWSYSKRGREVPGKVYSIPQIFPPVPQETKVNSIT